ncbi:MAG: sulfatase-like hydrolase/transferase [Verrucomicrobiales bacterium]|nr:sulfatase-like hydrolase/transferase [Verrucomicrobiales bacterium]
MNTILTSFLLSISIIVAISAAERPNIIVIMSDDMGISDIGCYGSEIDTPRLNKLAGNGLRFTQFYNTARCCPTRASLLSGLYPHQAGVGWMMTDRGHDGYRGEINRECLTIAEALKTSGYGTYMAGKWHVTKHISPDGSNNNWPKQRGFDRFYGTIHGAGSLWDPNTLTRDNTQITPVNDLEYNPKEPWFYTDAIADQTTRYIEEHVKSKPNDPFFCYVSFTAAHWPMHAREKTIAKYKGKYDAGYKIIRQKRFQKMKELGIIKKNTELSPQPWEWGKVKEQEWEIRCMEVYAAMVEEMDQGIGKIIDALESNGEMDNTLILFLQDNGGCAEAFGRSKNKSTGPRAEKPNLPPMTKDQLQTRMQPRQTRDGYPVRTGPGVMPGPADTYIGYGLGWANVSNTPFREYKHWVHEGGISTPLIAHWPEGIKRKGEIDHQPGHLIDIMATCVDLGKVNYPKERDGKKIKPLEGKSLNTAFKGNEIQRDAIYWEHEGNRAIRKGNWKLVSKENRPWELYNMTTDRTELHDLSKNKTEIVKELSKAYQEYADRANVSPIGTWRGKPRVKKKLSDQESFKLKSGDQLSQGKSPNIANRGILLEGKVESSEPNGVIIAQGGDSQGFALLLHNRYLRFITCVDGQISRVQTEEPLSKLNFTFKSKMTPAGDVFISINNKLVGSGKVTPLKIMPIDGLAVGSDPGGSVGEYEPGYPIQGKAQLTVKLLPQKIKPTTKGPLAQIKDEPNLPRVLIIGDSISIAYTIPVREILDTFANVHRPPANCASTKHGLESIDKWLGNKKWDVIHFNWGLHDLKYMGPNGENLADPKLSSNKQQVSIQEYGKNLEQLVKRMKKTGAKLIWRNTTPVPEGSKGRVVGDSDKYNRLASEIMIRYGIPTNDLYSFSKENWDEVGRKANVHFTPQGSKKLATLVAESIVNQLKK